MYISGIHVTHMMTSCNIIYSKEAIAEIDALLNSRKSILAPDGRFLASANTAIPKRVFAAFTS